MSLKITFFFFVILDSNQTRSPKQTTLHRSSLSKWRRQFCERRTSEAFKTLSFSTFEQQSRLTSRRSPPETSSSFRALSRRTNHPASGFQNLPESFRWKPSTNLPPTDTELPSGADKFAFRWSLIRTEGQLWIWLVQKACNSFLVNVLYVKTNSALIIF